MTGFAAGSPGIPGIGGIGVGVTGPGTNTKSTGKLRTDGLMTTSGIVEQRNGT